MVQIARRIFESGSLLRVYFCDERLRWVRITDDKTQRSVKIYLVATFQIKSGTCYFFWRALGVQEPDRRHPPVFGINPLPPQFHQLSAVVDGTPCREPRGLLSGINAIPQSWGQLDHQGRCPCDRGIANFPRGLPLPSRQAAFPRRLAVQLHRCHGLRRRAVSP